MLQPSEQEQRVLASLADSTEGAILLAYYKRLVDHITDTRQLTGPDKALEVEAANKASDIIEENLIQPLQRSRSQGGQYERLD